jgi:hypothetical protein
MIGTVGWAAATGGTAVFYLAALSLIGLDGPAGWAQRHRSWAWWGISVFGGTVAAGWVLILATQR